MDLHGDFHAGDGRFARRTPRHHPLEVRFLRARYPQIEVDPAPLYIDEGTVLTSAGSAASLDLCLHLVRKDFGTEMANTMARPLVVPPYREGGQAQYVESSVATSDEDDGVARSMTWALEHLTGPLTVEMLAGAARMSERSYSRHFSCTTGSSPMRWLSAQRVRTDSTLLEGTRSSVEEVSAVVGFESVVTYRYHFSRVMRTSPSAYRRMFRTVRETDGAKKHAAQVS